MNGYSLHLLLRVYPTAVDGEAAGQYGWTTHRKYRLIMTTRKPFQSYQKAC